MPVKAGYPTSIVFDQPTMAAIESLRLRTGKGLKDVVATAIRLYDEHLRELELADRHLDEVNK